MTVTLELNPELEARITAQASARGLTVAAYIRAVIENLSPVEGQAQDIAMTPQEKARQWEEWIETHAVHGSEHVDDSRESIYREREDSQL